MDCAALDLVPDAYLDSSCLGVTIQAISSNCQYHKPKLSISSITALPLFTWEIVHPSSLTQADKGSLHS